MLPFANRLYGIAQICFVARCVPRFGKLSLAFKAVISKASRLMSLNALPYPFKSMSFRAVACSLGILAGLALLLGAPAARAQAGGEVSGIWLTQAGDAKVRVSKCGGGLCGVIVWLKTPIDPATGKPAVDDKNPNPSLARRPMIGLPLFMGMQPSGPNKWSGQIYNADDGNSYASNVSVAGPGQLRVEGCVGALCGGETWSRTTR
jgi:uncharacterized protein (DUF2147 family)